MSRFLTPSDGGPRVGELPIRSVPVIPAHLSMAAARKVAELKRVPMLFVEHEGSLLGLLDEQALLQAADDAPVTRSLTAVSGCLHPELPAARARELFRRARAAFLPVAAGMFLLGMVSRADVERAAHGHRPADPVLTVGTRAAA